MLFVELLVPVELLEPETNGGPTVADAPVMVEFVPKVELVEVLLVPVLLADDVELLPVVEVEFPEVEPPVVLDVDELFIPEVAPGAVLVVALPVLLELLVSAPPGRTVTEPRLVPVVLPDVLLVVFALVDALLVTLKGAVAALPNESAASMSTLPVAIVEGTVTVAVKLPALVAFVLAGCAV